MPPNQDEPVIVTDYRFCHSCQAELKHSIAAYKDIEYHRCLKCHLETAWKPVGRGKLVQIEHRPEDRARQDYDFKRNDPRKYKPRR